MLRKNEATFTLDREVYSHDDWTLCLFAPRKYRSDGEPYSDSGKNEGEEALWLMALRCWAAAKTSGLGYSLYYSGSRLGGAVLINFMPFFLPTLSVNQLISEQGGSSAEEPLVGQELVESTPATEITNNTRSMMQELQPPEGVGVVEHNLDLNATDTRQRESGVLQACAA